MQNPLRDADIHALLHLLTIVEARVTEACDSILAQQLRISFVACGLLPDDARTDAVCGAVAQLQFRYRYSLGEYTEGPTEAAGEPQDR